MSTPDNPDPADLGADADDAAIDEALAALTSGMPMTATAEEDEDDEEMGEDVVGEGEEDDEDDEDEGEEGDDAADDLIGALGVPMAADAPINFEEPGAEEEAEPEESVMPIAMGGDDVATDFAPAAVAAPSGDARLARLEQLAEALIEAENTREGGKVKRKVKASASGAAVAGFIPVLLQLAGAFNLDPELVATLSAGAAALASFVTGYLTPEREPALDPIVAHKVTEPRRKPRTKPRRKTRK